MFISLLRKEIKTMGKKYVPSGYQIINIHLLSKEGGGYEIEESDDKEILREILLKRTHDETVNVKPILLRAVCEDYPFDVTTFPSLDMNTVKVVNGGLYIGITLDGDEKIVVEISES